MVNVYRVEVEKDTSAQADREEIAAISDESRGRSFGLRGKRSWNDIEDLRIAGTKQLNQAGEGIFLLLPIGAQHGHESLLRFGAV